MHDVIIIGGGCVGTSITYHLAKMGCRRALLLEKGHIAWGATGKSSAIVNVGVWNASEVLVKMLTESIRIFRDFAGIIGGDSGFAETGWLGLAGEDQAPRVRKTAAAARTLGAENRIISVSELKNLEPRISTSDLSEAVYEKSSGYADPVLTANAFAERAQVLGAKVQTRTMATKIRIESSAVKGVETDQGFFSGEKVVVAANVWAKKLLSGIGVQVPIEASRKQVCLFRRPDNFGRPHIVIDDFINDLYMKPEGERTLVGEIEAPGEPMDPDNYNEGLDPDRIVKYGEKLVRRIPSMKQSVSAGGYSGPYDVSPDGHPILDQIEGMPGLYVAVGFSGHGFRFSPVTGRLMAEFITNGRSDGIDISEFRLSRFEEGKPIRPIA